MLIRPASLLLRPVEMEAPVEVATIQMVMGIPPLMELDYNPVVLPEGTVTTLGLVIQVMD